jgi:two-component system, cell cycle sensor histidine kinase and response regulator CckA
VIRGYCDVVMEDQSTSASVMGRLEHISRAADRAASLTHQLLAFSRQQVLQPKILQLNELVSECAKMLHRLIGEDVEMQIFGTSGLGAVKADPGQIEQVILNLAVNARDAMPNGGTLTIETTNAELTPEFCRRHAGAQAGRYVMLRVTDTGTGMDEAILPHIFEPFYTTKELGKGTGLGLSMVYGIVKQSGGYILVESKVGSGTTFKIYLPRVEARADKTVEDKGPAENGHGDETILVVEDDEGVRELAREVLAARGYAVISAASPQEALQLCSRRADPIDLLITDAIMPGMSGREMTGKLAKERPGLRILLMSGYTEPQLGRLLITDNMASFLQKPFTPGALADTVRRILDQGRN